MNVELRPIQTKQDIEVLSPLVESIWREVFPPIIGIEQTEYMLLHYQSPEDIRREITEGVTYYFIESQNRNIGYLALETREDVLFVSKIYLMGSERGKGIASHIFDWLEARALAEGKKCLHLRVNRENITAIAVYEHRGFSIVKSAVTDIGSGFVMDDFYMEKQLAGSE